MTIFIFFSLTVPSTTPLQPDRICQQLQMPDCAGPPRVPYTICGFTLGRLELL